MALSCVSPKFWTQALDQRGVLVQYSLHLRKLTRTTGQNELTELRGTLNPYLFGLGKVK